MVAEDKKGAIQYVRPHRNQQQQYEQPFLECRSNLNFQQATGEQLHQELCMQLVVIQYANRFKQRLSTVHVKANRSKNKIQV